MNYDTTAPAYTVAHSLALIGLQIRPEYVPMLLSWSGVIGAALIAGWFGVAKTRADKRLSMSDLLVQLDTTRKERDNARNAEGILRDVVRDRDELIDDMTELILNHDRHAAEGFPPPPPPKSWRVRDHLAKWQAAHQTAGGA